MSSQICYHSEHCLFAQSIQQNLSYKEVTSFINPDDALPSKAGKAAHDTRVYPGFNCIKGLGITLLTFGSPLPQSIKFSDIHLYKWVETGK